MSTTTDPVALATGSMLDEKMKKSSPGKTSALIFLGVLLAGVIYIIANINNDLTGIHTSNFFPYLLLGVALLIALGFEFVNGFHDTANAVATVIYTHSLDPNIAVVWSGLCNLTGVLLSSGAVAFSVVKLLPVELILNVSNGSGFAMVFALLIAAILWNLATWWKGLPASSTHTMVGSIMGVGIMNQILQGHRGTAGIDLGQVTKVLTTLAVSPLVGGVMAAVLFFGFKLLLRDPRLYEAPKGTEPPPFWIRVLLIGTCTGVSYFHGSNDGQKGMGLIMLILVGTVPTAYALNHAIPVKDAQTFAAVSTQTAEALQSYIPANSVVGDPDAQLKKFVTTKAYEPGVIAALQQEVIQVRNESTLYGSLGKVKPEDQSNMRNKMYLASTSFDLLAKSKDASVPQFNDGDKKIVDNYKGYLTRATLFIPVWVKVSVALALGLGTMVGWKRIVVTVGEKIGKTHLTYAQGASAEITAMFTIWLADHAGLPVSTTHVLSSGVAGTMAANKSGLQASTIRNIAMAWVFTLPAAALLSAGLFWVFNLMAK